MHHQNVSSHSLNENLYDIALLSTDPRVAPRNRYLPRRVGLLSCLDPLLDSKRLSNIYTSRLAQPTAPLAGPKGKSPPNGPELRHESCHSHIRPHSNCSVSSGEPCKDSDDDVLVALTPFDATDSRLSSITNHSSYSSAKHGDFAVSMAELAKQPVHLIPERDVCASRTAESASKQGCVGQLGLSLSTVLLEDLACSPTVEPRKPAPQMPPPPPPKLRAVSTSSVLDTKRQPPCQLLLPPLARQNSATSSFLLTRCKTRYYNPKESKERKELRKKLYEENDDNDELLTNDLDLVFNVPVIKSHGEIYRAQRTESVPNMLLSRNDIVTGDDNKYPYKPTEAMKPCPLPGKLSRSNLSVDRIPTVIPELRPLNVGDGIAESDESEHLTFVSTENDSAICNNISEFYTQRSLSYSTLARASRELQLTNKLPNFVKSHSSVEDINLISPEKLEVVDQSRPINLPPKKPTDKSRHHRELHKVLTDFEASTKNINTMRKNLGLLAVTNQQSWFTLMMSSEENDFERKLNFEREKLRKLNWESLVSSRLRFSFFTKVLLLDCGKDFADSVDIMIAHLDQKVKSLSPQMRAAKEAEFNLMIEEVMQRPLFKNFMIHVTATKGTDFDLHEFRDNYRRLLYLKSFSEGGLHKHHQIFVIPAFLILFQNTESFMEICKLIEVFDHVVFSEEIFTSLNKKLCCWSNLSKLLLSSPVYKILRKFSSLQEFEHLTSTSFFELLIQLNDRLPLSLSAPSTPIVAQSPFESLAKTSLESEEQSKKASVSSSDSVVDGNSESIYSSSSSLSLIGIFLQLVVIYSRSKNKKQKIVNLFQSFLLTVFQYYHINWNSCGDLVNGNKSIKLNNSSDQILNLEAFVTKWKDIFRKL